MIQNNKVHGARTRTTVEQIAFFFCAEIIWDFFFRVGKACATRTHVFFSLFFPIPFVVFALLVLLPPSGNSDPGSHSIASLLPPPDYGTCVAFLSREGFSTFFPRRLASKLCLYPRYTRRSRQQLM